MSFNEKDPEAPQKFRQFAGFCGDAARKVYGFDISYDLESIRKLDQIAGDIGKPKDLEQMVLLFGSFFGEAICHLFKGRWEWNDRYKTWGVTFPLAKGGEDSAFVFFKVKKRLINGVEHSLFVFAEVIAGCVS